MRIELRWSRFASRPFLALFSRNVRLCALPPFTDSAEGLQRVEGGLDGGTRNFSKEDCALNGPGEGPTPRHNCHFTPGVNTLRRPKLPLIEVACREVAIRVGACLSDERGLWLPPYFSLRRSCRSSGQINLFDLDDDRLNVHVVWYPRSGASLCR
jgi:hypothetical protein